MDQLAYFLTREIIKRVPFAYLKVLKKLEYALYKALLAFILYSNSSMEFLKYSKSTRFWPLFAGTNP